MATVYDVLKEKIDADIAASKEYLAGGGPKDYSVYMETVGLIRGLETTRSYITDLANHMEREDD